MFVIRACMPAHRPAVHIVTIGRWYGDRRYIAHLLCRAYRKDGKVQLTVPADLRCRAFELVDLRIAERSETVP